MVDEIYKIFFTLWQANWLIWKILQAFETYCFHHLSCPHWKLGRPMSNLYMFSLLKFLCSLISLITWAFTKKQLAVMDVCSESCIANFSSKASTNHFKFNEMEQVRHCQNCSLMAFWDYLAPVSCQYYCKIIWYENMQTNPFSFLS